jgi:hypothetical protein
MANTDLERSLVTTSFTPRFSITIFTILTGCQFYKSMDEKISTKAITEYSQAYAAKLADQFFARKQQISGVEILSLCDVKQVNLFVIRELLNIWSHETEKIKSPYFDYETDEVKTALAQFQNVLSNHISVGKADFQHLLEVAIAKTIQLILSPYDFYSETLESYGKGYLKTEVLRKELKYLKINKAPLENLLSKLEERKSELITGNEAFALLDHILEEVNFTPEDLEQHLSQFSKLLPLKVESLFDQQSIAKINEKKVVGPTKAFSELPSSKKESQSVNSPKLKPNRLRDNLTINQKFMFTKILFKGDFEIFSEEIEKIESMPSLNHALAHLGDAYPAWDRESEEYEEFLEVLEKRFSQST